jgi:hypothetical protein
MKMGSIIAREVILLGMITAPMSKAVAAVAAAAANSLMRTTVETSGRVLAMGRGAAVGGAMLDPTTRGRRERTVAGVATEAGVAELPTALHPRWKKSQLPLLAVVAAQSKQAVARAC